MVLEKTLESPLDCKEIQPVHSEGDQPWDFFATLQSEPGVSEGVKDKEPGGTSRDLAGATLKLWWWGWQEGGVLLSSRPLLPGLRYLRPRF